MTMVRAALLSALVLHVPYTAAQHRDDREACKATRCLTLHGAKEADYILSFSLRYQTKAKTEQCTDHNWLAGLRVAKTEWEYFSVRHTRETYSINIPLDKHAGGACDWHPSGLFLSVMSAMSNSEIRKGGGSLFVFDEGDQTASRLDLACGFPDPKYSAPQAPKRDQYYCHEASRRPFKHVRLGKGSHTIQLNFANR